MNAWIATANLWCELNLCISQQIGTSSHPLVASTWNLGTSATWSSWFCFHPVAEMHNNTISSLLKLLIMSLFCCSVNASLSMWARRVCRWGTPAGSSTVWSMVSSQMARWQAVPPQVLRTPSPLSLVRQVLGNMSQGQFLLIWSPLSLVSIFFFFHVESTFLEVVYFFSWDT